jgi:hypothetical protein
VDPSPRKHLRLLGALNAAQESVISRLPLVFIVEKKSRALTLEDTRNPAVLVRYTPNGHTNAPLDSKARAGNILPGLHLSLGLCGRGGVCVYTDINLSVDNIDAKVSSGAESILENLLARSWGGVGWCSLGCKMGLVTNTVDLNTVRFDELDDADRTLGLGAVVFNVVIVVLDLSEYTHVLHFPSHLQNRRALPAYFFASLKAIGI